MYITLLIVRDFCSRQDHRLLSRERSQYANLFPMSLDKENQIDKEKSEKKPSLKRGIVDFYLILLFVFIYVTIAPTEP